MGNKLVHIEFDTNYNISKDYPKNNYNIITGSQLEKLQSICSNIKYTRMTKRNMDTGNTHLYNEDTKHEDHQVLLDMYHIGGTSSVVPINYILDIDIPNLRYRVIGTVKEIPEYPIQNNIIHELIKISKSLETFNQVQQLNTNVGIHISDLGLLNVREVDILTDACTDELQNWLDDGWRILAICPQPDQRRPDYIVGRNERNIKRDRRYRD